MAHSKNILPIVVKICTVLLSFALFLSSFSHSIGAENLSNRTNTALDSLYAFVPDNVSVKELSPTRFKKYGALGKFDLTPIGLVWNDFSIVELFDKRWKGQKTGLLSNGPVPFGIECKALWYGYFSKDAFEKLKKGELDYFSNVINIDVAKYNDPESYNRFWKKVNDTIDSEEVSDSYKIIEIAGGYRQFTTGEYAACLWGRENCFVAVWVPKEPFDGDMKKAEEIRDTIKNNVSMHFMKLD